MMRALAVTAVGFLLSTGSAFAAPHDTTLASRGGEKANGANDGVATSGDGRSVAFWSRATNLSADDRDPGYDLYRRDRDKGTTALVSRTSGQRGAKANGGVYPHDRPALSADGRLIAFGSDATNLDKLDRDARPDIYVRDLGTHQTRLVSRASGPDGAKADWRSLEPAISSDGRFVAFTSLARNLEPGAGAPTFRRWVYVRDLQTATTTLVSRAPGAGGDPADGDAGHPAISADGRFVAFVSSATNLSPDDRSAGNDIYLRDLHRGSTTLVSRATGRTGAKAAGLARDAAISADGRVVAFVSNASNLAPADSGTAVDVFVRDVVAGTTMLVSRATGANGPKGDRRALTAAISGDGRRVAFTSDSTNLAAADTVPDPDVYVRDLDANTTVLISRASGAAGVKGDGSSGVAAISGDGVVVAFTSSATNLSPDDSDALDDAYAREHPTRRLQFPVAHAAARPSPRSEFTPRAHPVKGGSCRTGWQLGGRCWERCPASHASLPIVRPKGFPRVRCVPRRVSRLAYGLELTASYHADWGDGTIQSNLDHAWSFRPRNEAVTLFRRCTLKKRDPNPGDLTRLRLRAVATFVDPAIACKRQERALQDSNHSFSLLEDVSLRAAGTLEGGRYSGSTTERLQETVWYEQDGSRVVAPCFNAATTSITGSGPTGVPAVLSTPERSSRVGGLKIDAQAGGTSGSLTYSGTGRLCPPVPKGAGRELPILGWDPTQPFTAPGDMRLPMVKGSQILNLFTPDLAKRFGDARIELHDTVERGAIVPGTGNMTQRGTRERLEVTLVLKRCKRQAPPSRCRPDATAHRRRR